MHFGSSQWRHAAGTRYLPSWIPVRTSRLSPCSVSHAVTQLSHLMIDRVHHQQRVGLDHSELAAVSSNRDISWVSCSSSWSDAR